MKLRGADIFKIEADELVEKSEQICLKLQSDGKPDKHLFDELQRNLHTLKGNANMFGFACLSKLIHSLEGFVETLVQAFVSSKLKLVFESLDIVKYIINNQECSQDERNQMVEPMVAKLENFSPSSSELITNVLNDETEYNGHFLIKIKLRPETMRLGHNLLYLFDDLSALGRATIKANTHFPEKIDEFDPTSLFTDWEVELITDELVDSIRDVFIFVEDLAEVTISPFKPVALRQDDQVFNDVITKQQKISNIRVDVAKIDGLMSLVSEIITTQARLDLFGALTQDNGLSGAIENMEKLTRRLRDLAFAFTLVPIDTLFTRFYRLVNDLSATLGKKVQLIATGGEYELDKNIVENLSEPLLHLIRNCLDHGIESATERLAANKPEEGHIYLRTRYTGGRIILEVEDDGAGIDVVKVRQKAEEKGIISPQQVLSESETLELIFHPGFSTADTISDISGRGVGTNVVKEKIASLRGSVTVATVKGKGTKFTLQIPLSLSVMDGLLCESGDLNMVFPVEFVESVEIIASKTFLTNAFGWVNYRADRIPAYFLNHEFGINSGYEGDCQMLVMAYEGRKVGIVVEKVIGEYQAVIKPLGVVFNSIAFLSGASILGDGTVALVFDPIKLIEGLSTNSQKATGLYQLFNQLNQPV